jgi:hypothetical protein
VGHDDVFSLGLLCRHRYPYRSQLDSGSGHYLSAMGTEYVSQSRRGLQMGARQYSG